MTPREYCKHNPPAAVYSDGMTGVTYHRRRVYHTRGGRPYFILDGRRVHLDECIRI